MGVAVTVTRAPVAVTAANLPRWRAGLALLSLDRCVPLFAEIGLPARPAAEPAGLLAAARAAVEALHQATGRSGSEASAAEARRVTGEALRRVAADYDDATAGGLEAWLGRRVLSEPAREAFAAWRGLLRRLCCLVARDDLTVPTPLNSTVMVRVCVAVHRHMAPRALAVFRYLLHEARSRPQSPWEAWLERQARQEAGGRHHLGAVVQALDLAEVAGADERTERAWHDLRAATGPAERAALHGWARRQAAALGIGREILDHEPFREAPVAN
jgi:hypothetical protein